MKSYRTEELCSMYPKKYICVTNINKNNENIIITATPIKVYETLEDCKKNSQEIKAFIAHYKRDFDIIYGDYEDYASTRWIPDFPVKSIFDVFGSIAFKLFGCK